jgi:CO dehydrogenase maturation factor
MTLSVAVAGKGGVGKTTFCALLVRCLRERGIRPILAVDADPNSNLAEALGVEPGKSLAEIRELGSSPEGSPASGAGRVRVVEDELQRAIAEAEGFDLITMGRPEGPRCYCYVNNLLRKSLDELAGNYRAVILDNEAGLEHLSRRTTNDVDFLLAVMNPTLPSFRAVSRIEELSRQLPIRVGRRAVLLNRVGPDGPAERVEQGLAGLGLERLPDVPQDDRLEQADATGENVFDLPAATPGLVAVARVADVLLAARGGAGAARPANTPETGLASEQGR